MRFFVFCACKLKIPKKSNNRILDFIFFSCTSNNRRDKNVEQHVLNTVRWAQLHSSLHSIQSFIILSSSRSIATIHISFFCSQLSKMADEDFDDGGDDGEVDTGVQLGFISKTSNSMFSNSDWEKWDGGKVGGKPSWLNPCQLPIPEQLKCNCCSSPMTFLLQIYCPLDDVEDAFHRSLYIFVCKKKKCVDSGNIKCLRCQLGRDNEYYPYMSKSAKTIEKMKESRVQPKLCNLCGCRAPSVCSRCKLVSYCSREHQAKDWKDHKRCCAVPLKTVEVGTENNSLEIAFDPDWRGCFNNAKINPSRYYLYSR